MRPRHRVLILSASTGMGHLRAGEALAVAAARHPAISEVLHVDALRYTNKVFRQFYGKFYIDLIRSAPYLLGWFYESQDEPWKTEKMRLMLDRMNVGPLVRMIKKFQPDITICTHFLPAEVLAHLMKKEKLQTRLSIVVTDYYVHAMWLSRRFHHYFVANQLSRVQLETIGFPPDRISVTGIPVDPLFEEQRDQRDLRLKFGLRLDRPLLLISAGAFGVGSARQIVQVLRKTATPAQVAVVCGKNPKLEAAVARQVRLEPCEHLDVLVMGFTSVMHEWMQAADLFIGKPGGLTSSEAMSCGLPMLIFEPIPGQEQRNSDFLLENGAAVKCNQITTMAYQVDRLLQQPAKLQSMRAAARAIGFPDAARQVVDILTGELQPEPYAMPREKRRKRDEAEKRIRFIGREGAAPRKLFRRKTRSTE